MKETHFNVRIETVYNSPKLFMSYYVDDKPVSYTELIEREKETKRSDRATQKIGKTKYIQNYVCYNN